MNLHSNGVSGEGQLQDGLTGLMANSVARCPYCQGAAGGATYPYATRWRGTRFSYADCTDCGATFIHPLPSNADLATLFDRSAYHELHYARLDPSPAQVESLNWMLPHLRAGGRMLDFGCANGAFMKAARAAGFEAEGAEQNPTSIAFAREMSGLPVASIEELLSSDQRFDAIHIADVLSHGPRPAELLRSLHGLLAPGGVMVIEGPLEKQRNLVYMALAGGKRLLRSLGRNHEAAHPPHHLTFSSWKSQNRFFRDQMHYRCIALDLHEDAWPFPTHAAPESGPKVRMMAMIGRTAVALSRSPFARPLGAFNRFRAVYLPPTKKEAESVPPLT